MGSGSMTTKWYVLLFLVALTLPTRLSLADAELLDGPANAAPPQDIWVPTLRLTNGPQVRSAFREAVEAARPAIVLIRSADGDVALGGIVGQDGWVLTKASCLRGDVTCRLSDGRELDARLVGIHREYDLAMLKLDAKRLPVLELNSEVAADVGEWVATPGTEQDPLAVGVVSVPARPIRSQPGILGVRLEEGDRGPRVLQVFPDTGAAEAGILIHDVIVSINQEPTENREQLQQQIRRYSPGDLIEVGIQRGDTALTVKAELTGQLAEQRVSWKQYQNLLGGELSRRRFGFPLAFQHDTVLRPADCGGPLVNLDGKVVGFNIARAGRTESYAIPTHVIVTLLYDLMSGNLAP